MSAIVYNKVLHGKGWLFFSRWPSNHAWFGLLWTFLMLWMFVQGFVLHSGKDELPGWMMRNLHKNFGSLGKAKASIRPVHRWAGIVAFTVACVASRLGLQKIGRIEYGDATAGIWAMVVANFLVSGAAGPSPPSRAKES